MNPPGTYGYFIAPDARGEDHIWREGGDFPIPVLGRHTLQHDPDIWRILTDAIPTRRKP